MLWRCVALALVACEAPREPAPTAAPVWELAPSVSAWPLGAVTGRIGRGLAPQVVTARGVPGAPIANVQVWQVDDAGADRGPALAVIGERDRSTVELFDLAGGRALWRTTCDGSVIGPVGDAVLCRGDNALAALSLAAGTPAWKHAGRFARREGGRVAVFDGDGVTVIDATTGTEVAHEQLPAGDTFAASCGGEVYATTARHELVRLGAVKWATSLVPARIECSGDALLVETGGALVAVTRALGKQLGRIDNVRDVWTARDDAHRLEVSTAWGVVRASHDLVEQTVLDLPPMGPLLAAHGDRRLVRLTPGTAVLLDHRGVRAYLAVPETSAAIGGDHVLAGDRYFDLPPPWRGPPPRAGLAAPIALAAELRDLPEATPLDTTHAVALDSGDRTVVATALTDRELIVATEQRVVHLALAPLAWRAPRTISAPVTALAASNDGFAYATASDVVIDNDFATRRIHADALDTRAHVTLVHTGARTLVLDDDALPLGELATAICAVTDARLVISYERNRVVARLPQAWMLPVWSLAIDGVVAAVERAGDGAVVMLEDGDAYHVDRAGNATAIAGVGLAWHGESEVVLGSAPGGPIPPNPIVPPVAPPEIYKPTDLEAAPAIATPWPPPPASPASWQLAIYELGGGLRARNDYPLTGPITPALRTAGAPLVYRVGREVVVIDPRNGDPLRRVTLPEEAPVFSTIVDGKPLVGTILAAPLRAVVF